ncbi:four-carbon acid sugar kinase family protein [Acidiphilium multivorum]|uniref:four-carbon acid sugar kinase family protein n=1 Tax=Acidiphilium multivorum TaxID=62140 RepID=UPI0039C956D3
MTTSVRLVADDLTGALDAAVQFTGRNPGLPVLLRARNGAPVPETAAISTASRDLDADAAGRLMAAAAPFLARAGLRFLKIDSLLRGHWPRDLAILLGACPDHVCILAPAFPAQRRITRNGRQYAPGADGILAALPRSPGEELALAGCRARHIPAGALRAADLAAAPGTVLICDALVQEDLDRLVVVARGHGAPILWCGSAGLARALAGEGPCRIVPEPGPQLILIGSDHPVTHAQIAAVPPSAAARVALGTDGERAASLVAQSLARTSCIVTADLPRGLAPAEAAPMIAARLAATLPRLPRPSGLVVIGGETLASVCDVIGAEALCLAGEILPGVPVSRIGGGLWDGVRLISRSGAFGAPDFLARLLDDRLVPS